MIRIQRLMIVLLKETAKDTETNDCTFEGN